MKAMVLAAGLGTRLRPLTDHQPKALVRLGGRTLLEIVLARLRAVGVDEVIVNTHHFADQIAEYLAANDHFGLRVEISHEKTLLETGGGLKHAAEFFLRDGSDAPFLLHNVDIVSTIDLAALLRAHARQPLESRDALATLAVQQRASTRQLLVDETGALCGRRSSAGEERVGGCVDDNALAAEAVAFAGIHVLSPRIFARLTEQGAFSIIDSYLRLSGEGERIGTFDVTGAYWRDVGTAASLAAAEADEAAAMGGAVSPD